MTEALHAPLPPADYGLVGGALDLLPADEYEVVQLTSPRGDGIDYTEAIDGLLGPLGLPTGRLILRDGLQLFTGVRTGVTWLAVDYLVPGTMTRDRGPDRAPGPDVQLNYEAGRAQEGEENASEPALDRWFAPFAQPLPRWLAPITGELQAAMDGVAEARRAMNDAHWEHTTRLAAAQQRLADAWRDVFPPEPTHGA
jgi:hypothetical protein